MIHAGRALVAAGLLATLTAAGTAWAEEVTAPAPGSVDIVNGIPTNLQPTTGALLFVGPFLKNQFLDCSGVLIGCRTVLTSAHCVCKNSANYADCVANDLPNLNVADLRFFLQHSGLHHVRDIYIDPSWVAGAGGDLAVLRLSELVTGIEPSPFHQGYPTKIVHGTAGIIAGFGNSGDGRLDAAIKRVGAIVTAECPTQKGVFEPANVCWDFTAPVAKPGDESNLCLKDDGGPLFIDFGNGPEVAGIHTGGGATCDVDSYSHDTNVVRSREWLQAVGGPDVKRNQCSPLGEVGEPWVQVQGGAGTLLRNQDEKRIEFDVPQDALVLRVTVNGDSEKLGDYDMFVGLNEKLPTHTVYDCHTSGVGQFGACEFDATGASRVNVLIRQVKPFVDRGHSRFQVTTTAFEPIPPLEDPPRGPDLLQYTKRGPGYRTFTWVDDSDNETGFELQRRPGTDPAASFATRKTIVANRQTAIDATPDGVVFTYRIRAFNLFGPSEWSNLCIVNLHLRRPTNLHTVTIAPSSVKLRWLDNNSGESGVEVQRRVSGAIKWKILTVLPPDIRNYVDGGVVPGESYEYRVRARGYVTECVPNSPFSAILAVSTPAS